MALDEPRDGDKSFESSGFQFVVAERDEDWVLGGGGIRVDRIESGFGGFFHVSRRHGTDGCC